MDKAKMKKIADYYGFESQSRQLTEEMAELTVAINKYYRFENKLKNAYKTPCMCLDEQKHILDIIEEISDVEIMLEQIKYMLVIEQENIDRYVERKLDRQIERIKKEEQNV